MRKSQVNGLTTLCCPWQLLTTLAVESENDIDGNEDGEDGEDDDGDGDGESPGKERKFSLLRRKLIVSI
jgi:hypothetical protein